MVKRITAALLALALALGLSLAAVSPASAEGESNHAITYVTPNTSEKCNKDDQSPEPTYWDLSKATVKLPADKVWTKVIIKAGNTGADGQGPENDGYYTDASYQYPAAYADLDWKQVSDLATRTFSHTSLKGISHVIYCYATAPLTDVAGSASRTNEVCTNNALVGGVITVVVTTGVVYEVKNSTSNSVVPFDAVTGATLALSPGAYTVTVSAASGYHLTSATPIHLTISPYDGSCGNLTDVAGSASRTNEVCTNNALVGGVITVVVTTGVVYEVKNSTSNSVVPFDAVTGATLALSPGAYTVQVSAASGYHLTSATPIHLTISPYDGSCGPVDSISVTPTASGTNQVCTEGSLVNGTIVVGIKPGVDYTITDSNEVNVPFNPVTGKTGPLAAGTYIVHPTAQSGYVLSDSSNIDLTVIAAEGCVSSTSVRAETPTFTDAVCTESGSSTTPSYTIADTTGVQYQVSSDGTSFTNVDKGLHVVAVGSKIWVKPVAKPGYVLSSSETFGPHTFSAAEGCVSSTSVRAETPMFTDAVCTESGSSTTPSYTIADTTGVQYQVSSDGTSFTNVDKGLHVVAVGSKIWVKPVAENGYVLSSSAPFGPHTFSAAEGCVFVPPTLGLLTPKASSTPITCTTAGSYTLVNDEGLIWLVDGVETPAGTYNVSQASTVRVVATTDPTKAGLEANAQTEWTFTFTKPICQLTTLALPESNGTLAFTGSNGTLAGGLLLGLIFMVVGAGAITVSSVRRRTS